MRKSSKRKLKNAARAGVSGIGSIIRLLLRTIGTLLLIVITTCAIIACIFVMYVKTNLASSEELKVSLEDMAVNLSSVIYYKDNDTGDYVELCTLEGEENRVWVDYDNIPKDMEHAVVSIEDHRFYQHHGVDWYRTSGAFVNMFLGMRNTFGGSTITQQLIKNITEDNEATVQRKLTEIFRALEFEKNYDKKDIIEGYLNIVYFGHGRYGIGAAAELYFDKEVSELTLAEMCSIVGITNNPSIYSPYVSPEKNKERQEIILDSMLKYGYISEAECEAAKAEKLHFEPYSPATAGTPIYPYYVDTLIEDVINYLQESRGVSRTTASSILFNGGLKIYAAIDMDIQEKVDSIYENLDEIPETSGSSQQLQSGIVIMNPYNGNIVALSGGVGEKKVSRGLNWATSTNARRPVGSSIKPISVYAPAMDLGLITPDTTFEDEADIVLNGTDWFPKNDNHKNYGVVTIKYAVQQSLNTIAAQVLDILTPEVSYAFLRDKLGVVNLDENDIYYPALASGQFTYGLTVREIAQAYTIFPNSGIYTEARTFTHIYSSEDVLVYENVPESHTAISDTTAYWMTELLKNAVENGTGKSARLDNMPVAGKTGTTSNNWDRYFAGYTPYYVAAVWTGYPNPEQITTSGNPAAKLWQKVMALVHEDLEYKDFTTPANTYQSPVPGVGDPIPYYIRGVAMTNDGGLEVLYEEKVGERGLGRTVQVTAKTVDGYTLTQAAEGSLVLTENPEDNIYEFVYKSNTPPPEDPPIVEPDLPDLPDVPDIPDVPDDPSVPDVPNVPDTPDVPDVPDVPDTPDTPNAPDEPDAPEDPDNGQTGDDILT